MAVNRIDKAFAAQFQKEISEAIQTVTSKHGMKALPSRCTFIPEADEINIKLPFRRIPTDGKTVEQVEFERHASSFGLNADLFGKEIILKGKTYHISGIRPASWKRPIIIKDETHHAYVVPVETINRCLGIQEN
jgi:hypothetical protein